MIDFKALVRPHILNLKPYNTARDDYSGEIGIFLDANENSLGSAVSDSYNRYPDPHQVELKAKVAAMKGMKPEQVFLGSGSDEVIDLLIRVFCEPGHDKIMVLSPTYGMYAVCAAANNVDAVNVPLTESFSINISQVLKNAADVKLLFLCSPNNPSGNCLPQSEIAEILKNFAGLVILDEAYVDFAPGRSWLPRLSRYPNLVIMQTFSKAWGLANLRLGMAFADSVVVNYLSWIKYPYNISGLTQELALQVLQNEPAKEQMVTLIIAERKKLELELTELPVVQKVYPSDANFLLVKFDNAQPVFEFLIEQRIIVRDRSHALHCDNCLRITVGTPEENKTLISKLKEFNPR
jgi:histidinol-phosphate aminotransferase